MSRERSFALPGEVVASPDPSPQNIRVQIDLRLKRDDVEIEVSPSGERRNAPSHDELCKLACRIYDARREREKMLDRKLFGEPGWDMLLALYCLPTRGERLGITALAHASGVPQTTALRWQEILTEDGLVERFDDENDGRRSFVRLTEKGRILLEDYLLKLYDAGF